MGKGNIYMNFRIRKRPWYAWFLGFVWILWLLLWAEVALGSWKEMEYKAFYISLTVFLISLVVGFLVWLWRYIHFKRVGSS